jgi:hypothetical protein
MAEWRYSSYIFYLGTRWRSAVIFKSCCSTPGERAPQYLFARRLGEPQCKSGDYGEEKNLGCAGNRTMAFNPIITAELWRKDCYILNMAQ